jgi:imidazolonepropionase
MRESGANESECETSARLDILFHNCNAATMADRAQVPYGAVAKAALAVEKGRIAWIGPEKGCPVGTARTVVDLRGAWITPGLIDCHTHLVFAGNRAREWEMRRKGASYEDIARAGGGILSTVEATRAATEDALVHASLPRARALAAHGVTTAEIKSGYGLTFADERKMLHAALRTGEAVGIRVSRSFLGAHALPKEFASDRAAYVDLICREWIPAIARERLADSVDAFCDTIAFTPAETERVFAAAKANGLAVRLHAEQLSDQGGAALAAKYDALSADHLEHLSDMGIEAIKKSGTVAVLLPLPFYFLREEKKPPVAKLRAAGVPIAIATDCNPGTSPAASPLLAMNMACTLLGLSPEDALCGFTRNAAHALGLGAETGTLEARKSADLAIWNISDPSELAYWMGIDLLRGRYLEGRSVHEAVQ